MVCSWREEKGGMSTRMRGKEGGGFAGLRGRRVGGCRWLSDLWAEEAGRRIWVCKMVG